MVLMMIIGAFFRGKNVNCPKITAKAGRRAAAWIAAIAMGVCLSCPLGHCERLYRWKNSHGQLYYSNVAPPADHQSFDVVVTGAQGTPAPRKVPSPQRSGKAAVSQVVPPGLLRALLTRRIQKRKKEIRAMAALLRKRPDDSRLRGALMRKKLYLDEDIKRLHAYAAASGKARGARAAQGGHHGRHR